MKVQKQERIKTFLLTEDDMRTRRSFALNVLASLEPETFIENEKRLELHSWFFVSIFSIVMMMQGSLIYTSYPIFSACLFSILFLVGHFVGTVIQKGRLSGFLMANLFSTIFILFAVLDLLYYTDSMVGPLIMLLTLILTFRNGQLSSRYFSRKEVMSFIRIYFRDDSVFSFIAKDDRPVTENVSQ